MSEQAMTRGETSDLLKLIRQRERVLKSAAKQRSAELLANFEAQLGQCYSFDQDEVWEEAYRIGVSEIDKLNVKIAARCRELGIPKWAAPKLTNAYWLERGDNLVKERRGELRKMAVTRISASERKAVTQIEMACLNAQTKLTTISLSTAQAKKFIEQLPRIETLMPHISVAEIEQPLLQDEGRK